jgi:hypothetical protein
MLRDTCRPQKGHSRRCACAFRVERGCGAVDRVGGQHHVGEFFNRAAGLVAHLVEIVGVGELAQQMGYIASDIGIVQTQFAFVTVANRLLKERLEWMGLHTILLWLHAQPVCCEAVAGCSFACSRKASHLPVCLSLTLRLSDVLLF